MAGIHSLCTMRSLQTYRSQMYASLQCFFPHYFSQRGGCVIHSVYAYTMRSIFGHTLARLSDSEIASGIELHLVICSSWFWSPQWTQSKTIEHRLLYNPSECVAMYVGVLCRCLTHDSHCHKSIEWIIAQWCWCTVALWYGFARGTHTLRTFSHNINKYWTHRLLFIAIAVWISGKNAMQESMHCSSSNHSKQLVGLDTGPACWHAFPCTNSHTTKWLIHAAAVL